MQFRKRNLCYNIVLYIKIFRKMRRIWIFLVVVRETMITGSKVAPKAAVVKLIINYHNLGCIWDILFILDFKLMLSWSSYAMVMKWKPWDEIQDGRQYNNSRQSRVYQFNYTVYLTCVVYEQINHFWFKNNVFFFRLCNGYKIKASRWNPRWPTKCFVVKLCTKFKTSFFNVFFRQKLHFICTIAINKVNEVINIEVYKLYL